MTTLQNYSMLGGLFAFNFSNWNCKQWDLLTVPFTDYKMSLHYPGFFMSSIFYFGLGTSAYYCGKALMRLGRRVMTYFKSVSNATKYLNAKVGDVRKESYTAVIYGAGTKAGRIYAHFLA